MHEEQGPTVARISSDAALFCLDLVVEAHGTAGRVGPKSDKCTRAKRWDPAYDAAGSTK